MKLIKELSPYDFETIAVPNGYDLKSIPDLTRDNLGTTIDKLNEVIERVNALTPQEDTT